MSDFNKTEWATNFKRNIQYSSGSVPDIVCFLQSLTQALLDCGTTGVQVAQHPLVTLCVHKLKMLTVSPVDFAQGWLSGVVDA